jgi:cell division protein FtsB
MKKYKMTGCARFFLFLIIFLPAVYFGVSYFNGEDGLQNIKDFLGVEQNDGPRDEKNDTKELSSTKEELGEKDKTISNLNEQIEQLKETIKQKDLEIENLKQQLSSQN